MKNMQNKSFSMLAKTFKGLESVLAQELMNLGAEQIEIGRRSVSFVGDMSLMYRANFCLRTASRVLVKVKNEKLKVKGESRKPEDQIYDIVKGIDWSQYMRVDQTFSVDATVYSELFHNSLFITYRVKDAIVDYWNETAGKRPNVRTDNPDIRVNLHVGHDEVTVSLDSSGESLHKRGYRVANTEAPLNEALAAGMLLLAGWHGQSDLYDPMCGSGTLLIEAALIALNIAPGIFRKEFGFERWPNFDAELLETIYNDDTAEREFKHRIYGSDAGFYAVQTALKNIQSAHLGAYIDVKQVRIQELHDLKAEKALVIMNPPYGERLSHDKDVLRLYQDIGSALKHHFAGADAWIISSNEEALKCIGLKPKQRIHVLNGELECLFNHYELFAGTRKQHVTYAKHK